jgi:hypothetical protein
MPVIGTPTPPPPAPPSGACDTQAVRTAPVTKLYGTDLLTKRRAISVSGGAQNEVQLQLFSDAGNPVDLTDCAGAAGSVTVRIREVISTQQNDIQEQEGSVLDITTGLVSFVVPETVANNPGVYNCELGVFDDEDDLLFTNQFYLWINRGLFANSAYPHAGPPTIDEIRLFIRDNAPEENLLLDNFEFDLAEMCHATESAVRYWNEVNPDIGVYYNTVTYCARYKWLQAIAGHMMLVAAYRFRRNHLPYQAGGLSIDDQNKFQQYDQIGQMLIQDYREWVKTKKVAINCYAAMTSQGSAYGSLAYQMINGGV